MPIRHCSPIFPPPKHSRPPRHLVCIRCSSSAPPLRPYRLVLQLDKSSAMRLDELVACFGSFGGLKLKTHRHSSATIISNLPAEHVALYPEIVRKICHETCNFPIGKGRLRLFKTTGVVALMILPPAEVYSIWGEMWKAMKGLPGAERLETPVGLMIPVLHPPIFTRKGPFIRRLEKTFPDGIPLNMARGLFLQEGPKSQGHPVTIPFSGSLQSPGSDP